MTKVLVTGGSGFIGREIVKVLKEQGFEVNVIDMYDLGIEGVEFFRGSVLNPEIISKAMMGCDYVIHMAAILGVSKASYEPVECLDVNIQGTRNVLRCCVIHKVKKILFPSSSEVYGEPKTIPVTEETGLQPKSEYGVSKSVGEEYIKAYHKQHGLNYTVVRYFNVYGDKQGHSWVMAKFINNAVIGKPLKVFGEGNQVRSFCHVRDSARGTVVALLSPEANGQVFNIGNNKEPLSMKELAEKVLRLSGREEGIEMVPFEHSDRSKEREIFKRIPCTEKAKNVFGFEATLGVDQGIREIIDSKKLSLEEVRKHVENAEAYERRIANKR